MRYEVVAVHGTCIAKYIPPLGSSTSDELVAQYHNSLWLMNYMAIIQHNTRCRQDLCRILLHTHI